MGEGQPGAATSEPARLTVSEHHYQVVGWGENAFGQLGDGSTVTSVDEPTATVGLKFVTAVAGGGHHSVALLTDGSVSTWGEDEYG